MTPLLVENPRETDQARLAEALDGIKGCLRRHASGPDHASANGDAATSEIAGDLGPPTTLETLCRAFYLSPFERDVVLLCAGIEFDSGFGPLCAQAQGDPSRSYPTFSLALAALPGAHWSALTTASPLRRWRLIEVGHGPSLTASPLRIDERILHFLAGVSDLDERLVTIIEPLGPGDPDSLAASQKAVADRVAACWSASMGGPRMPIVQLFGLDPADRRGVAVEAAARLGLRIARVPADQIPASSSELETLIRLWEREAALEPGVLLLELEIADPPGSDLQVAGRLARFAARLAVPLIVSEREPRNFADRESVRFEVRRPTVAEQRTAWDAALGSELPGDPSALEAITAQFSLGLVAIRLAAAKARLESEPSLGRDIWDACRSVRRSRIDDLAQRVESLAGWDDLILPGPQAEAVRRIGLHVRHRSKVYDYWGFGSTSSRGLGISALFSGVSGTGKTLAAEVLANELRLDLYKVDLSCVVSKYIGETEKNLRRIFDAAEDGGVLLLFDEADALFGKRSEVKDSHDRYANIEVSYLLQRMEAYRGLAILTTNLKAAIDPAFLRRIRFVVQFPFPDPVHRIEIWRRAFPRSTPTDGLDFAKLAKLNVPGGNIRNIALNAAFLAAPTGGPIRMCHLREASQVEYAKMERSLTETEIGGWT